jgi:hypothetical protein
MKKFFIILGSIFLALIVLGVIGFVVIAVRGKGPAAIGIAVMPFENLNEEKANLIVADKIYEGVVTILATKVRNVKVIRQSSVMDGPSPQETKDGTCVKRSLCARGKRAPGGRPRPCKGVLT